MCGRFTLRAPSRRVAEHFGLEEPPELSPRFNVAPGQDVLTIRVPPGGGARLAESRRWGLVPCWANDPRVGNRMINARAETLAERPAFRDPARRRRCLVPADGFYEWKAGPGSKQPYLIERPHGGLLAFAGLWEHWQGRDGERVDSCTVVTTAANERLRPLHDRMPVVLAPEDYARWLDPERGWDGELRGLLRPCPESWLDLHAVSRRVNDVSHDDAECTRRVPEPLTLFG